MNSHNNLIGIRQPSAQQPTLHKLARKTFSFNMWCRCAVMPSPAMAGKWGYRHIHSSRNFNFCLRWDEMRFPFQSFSFNPASPTQSSIRFATQTHSHPDPGLEPSSTNKDSNKLCIQRRQSFPDKKYSYIGMFMAKNGRKQTLSGNVIMYYKRISVNNSEGYTKHICVLV